MLVIESDELAVGHFEPTKVKSGELGIHTLLASRTSRNSRTTVARTLWHIQPLITPGCSQRDIDRALVRVGKPGKAYRSPQF